MRLTTEQEAALVAIVRHAAQTEIMPRFRSLPPEAIAAKSGPEDLVTEADLATEARISAGVRALLPEALVIGEEAVAADPSLLEGLAKAPLAVVIDPVDGTNNFADGLATFGVILAVVARGETVFGLLFDPVMEDWILARRGGGAWLCRDGSAPQRLRPQAARPVARTRAWVNLALYPQDQRLAVMQGFPPFARVTTLGCSCHEYRQMALGHVQAMVSPVAKPWDHAAGALVIEEIGGSVCNGTGARWTPATPQAPIIARLHPDQPVPPCSVEGSPE